MISQYNKRLHAQILTPFLWRRLSHASGLCQKINVHHFGWFGYINILQLTIVYQGDLTGNKIMMTFHITNLHTSYASLQYILPHLMF
jgi:hypothetical protein